MREVIIDSIEPASSRAAELGLPGLFTPAMDAWFTTCLQRDLSMRFSTAAACRDALLRALPATGHVILNGPANASSGTVPVVPAQPSPAASTLSSHQAAPSGAQPATSIDSGPASAPVPPPPSPVSHRPSLLPHVSIITCGTIVLALIGSCVSVVLYGTYRANQTATPLVRTHHVVGFDASEFDPGKFLSTASELAREHDPSAELVRISVTGVGKGNTMVLTKEGDSGSRSVVYSYRADRAHRDYCSVNVIVDKDGVASNQAKTVLCTWEPIPDPKCSVFEVRDKAIAQGAKPAREQSLSYQPFAGGRPMWAVTAGSFTKILPDDCP